MKHVELILGPAFVQYDARQSRILVIRCAVDREPMGAWDPTVRAAVAWIGVHPQADHRPICGQLMDSIQELFFPAQRQLRIIFKDQSIPLVSGMAASGILDPVRIVAPTSTSFRAVPSTLTTRAFPC